VDEHRNHIPPAKDPPVVAVVLNWHARETTLACLAALRALDYDDLSIVLVDNESHDFRDHSFPSTPPVTYLHAAVNLGFSGGCNLGMRHALESGADFIWFLNNDAVPEPDSLRHLVAAAAAAPPPAVLGAKILRQSTAPARLDSIAVAVDCTSGRYQLIGHDEIDDGRYDDRREVDAVTGCALLLRADAARRLGGFDDRYYLYLEDLDLCLRARAAGLAVAFAPAARVWHDRPPARRGRQSEDSLYYTCRNHFLLMETHGRGGAARRLLRNATILALNVAYALLDDPRRVPRRLRATLAGACDYARGRRGPRVSPPGI
jgi:hypothetical protein